MELLDTWLELSYKTEINLLEILNYLLYFILSFKIIILSFRTNIKARSQNPQKLELIRTVGKVVEIAKHLSNTRNLYYRRTTKRGRRRQPLSRAGTGTERPRYFGRYQARTSYTTVECHWNWNWIIKDPQEFECVADTLEFLNTNKHSDSSSR